MNSKQKKYAAAGLLLLLCLGMGLLWKYAGTPLIRFVSEPQAFRDWVDAQGWIGRAAFVGMVFFQVLVAVIPGEPFEIAAGFAFGAVEGTVLCMIGAALGSIITFWLVRIFGMKLVRVFFSEEQIASIRFLKTDPKREMLFLIVYIIPGTPKDLLGYFAGLTDIRFPVFLLICSLGRIPSLVTSTIGGSALGSSNYTSAVITFVLTLAISAAGLLVYNHIRNARGKGQYPQ